MSKDMKLIMESWRKNVIQEDPRDQAEIQTVGQLKQAIKGAIQAKRMGKVTDELKGVGAGILIDMIPGAGTIKSIFDVVKNTYSMPDNKRTNTGLDNLNVDDKVSLIVDDRIENQFLKDLSSWANSQPDSAMLANFNVTKRLQKFISDKYAQRTVAVPQQRN